MAGLNLVPNPAVLLVQSGIFLTTLYAVKKLFITPYLSVREKRQSVTVGAHSGAEKLNADARSTQEHIDKKMSAVIEESKQTLSMTKQEINEEKNKIIEQARKESAEIVEHMRQQLTKELAEERAKVPAVVNQLTEAVFNKAMQ